MEPVEPVPMNIYQNNNYRIDLSWPHFNDELRVKYRRQMKDQQSTISVFVAYLTARSTSLDTATVFYARP